MIPLVSRSLSSKDMFKVSCAKISISLYLLVILSLWNVPGMSGIVECPWNGGMSLECLEWWNVPGMSGMVECLWNVWNGGMSLECLECPTTLFPYQFVIKITGPQGMYYIGDRYPVQLYQ